MMPDRMSKFLYVSAFILAAVLLEYIRRRYGIPVTILDIFLLPLSLIFSSVLLKDFFFRQNPADQAGLSLRDGVFRALVALLLFFPLGAWSLWEGIRNPLDYFSGIKGAAHGYTLIGIGLFCLSLGIMLAASVVRGIRAAARKG
jgi:hypothetical protein